MNSRASTWKTSDSLTLFPHRRQQRAPSSRHKNTVDIHRRHLLVHPSPKSKCQHHQSQQTSPRPLSNGPRLSFSATRASARQVSSLGASLSFPPIELGESIRADESSARCTCVDSCMIRSTTRTRLPSALTSSARQCTSRTAPYDYSSGTQPVK